MGADAVHGPVVTTVPIGGQRHVHDATEEHEAGKGASFAAQLMDYGSELAGRRGAP